LASTPTAQPGSSTFTDRQSAVAHRISGPLKFADARDLDPSIACIAPITPVSGANTPMVEHCTSSTSPSSGNRQA
jgi:hypothetical protein